MLRGEKTYLIICKEHSVMIGTALPSTQVKTKTYQFYHKRFWCFSLNASLYELQERLDLFFLRKSSRS